MRPSSSSPISIPVRALFVEFFPPPVCFLPPSFQLKSNIDPRKSMIPTRTEMASIYSCAHEWQVKYELPFGDPQGRRNWTQEGKPDVGTYQGGTFP